MTSRLLATLFALTLSGATAGAERIRIDGSSTVYPIAQAAAAAYRRQGAGSATVTIGISGTGGGFRKFCRGEIDIANASRPILVDELRDCRAAGIEFIELPIAFDAITVVVNPRNAFLREISVEELRRVWEPAADGKLRAWRQVNPAWPDAPIRLYGPGRDSGTFDYFTEAVVGKARASRTDYFASEDDRVLVQGVQREPDALGYFGIAYYWEHRTRLRAVAISTGGRAAVAPTRENVISGAYRPLSRPLFAYVSNRALERPEVREFADSLLADGARFAGDSKYVPLPADAYAAARRFLRERRIGSVFDGVVPIGITIDELLRREARR